MRFLPRAWLTHWQISKSSNPQISNPQISHLQISASFWHRFCLTVHVSYADDLSDRVRRLAVRVIRFARALARGPVADPIVRQLVRCGCGVSANYRSARRSRSRAEFIARLAVVVEEADEAEHWLAIICAIPNPQIPKSSNPQILKSSNLRHRCAKPGPLTGRTGCDALGWRSSGRVGRCCSKLTGSVLAKVAGVALDRPPGSLEAAREPEAVVVVAERGRDLAAERDTADRERVAPGSAA